MVLAYPVESVPSLLVDNQGLQNLVQYCSQPNARVALIGFNECAKHVINLCGDHIVGIYDPEPWKQGITFRGKTVVDRTDRLDIGQIAICDILLAYDFADEISQLYDDKIQAHCPPRLLQKPTISIDPFTQEHLYKAIFSDTSYTPPTMMGREKLCLLMELLRYALQSPGDVIEMGVWQGGSAWYIAKLLLLVNEDRRLYLVDQFDLAVNNRNATMCNDEIFRALSFYPAMHMVPGLVTDPRVLSQLSDTSYCFAHYDLGLHLPALDHIWSRLSPGAPLVLDNYGLLAANPGRFDRYFAGHGARVIRLPWSGQGLVFKGAAAAA